ncbi:MAG TPA: hypothetical protein VFX30_08240 [bacterium]|nr:hypothetical protein [bacterium]
MKTINTLFALLFVAGVAASGCGSAGEFQVDASDVPMESPADQGLDPQVAPEEVAPAPQADADEAVVPEETEDAAETPVLIQRKFDPALLEKEFAHSANLPQNLIKEDDRTAVYHFGGAQYFAQHPDAQIKTEEDDRVAERPLIELTPEQKKMLLDKAAVKYFQGSVDVEKLKCLAEGNGREDCED